jgi:two-component system KDP operon response regulator KdpE
MSKSILVIDDDRELLTLLRLRLELEDLDVVTAEDGKKGLSKALETHPDAIILDIMIPEMDGWSMYRQLRKISQAPIVILTTMASRQDKARWLAWGADDYITKPFSFEELCTRIQGVLGRCILGTQNRLAIFDDGHLRVDLIDGATVRDGKSLDLTPTESRMLIYMARRKGQAVSHQELLVNMWGPDYAEEVSYLDLYVRHLCQKIELDPACPRYIHAIGNMGYCFAHVSQVLR